MVTLLSIERFYSGRIDWLDLFELVRQSGIQVKATKAGVAVTVADAIQLAKLLK